MDGFDNLDIVKLCELLKPKGVDQSDSEDELQDTSPSQGFQVLTPGDVGKKSNAKERKPSVYTKITEEKSKNVDVFDPENDGAYFDEQSQLLSEWKKTPQWDVSYKQQVTSSDVFLQMNGKSTSTASCEDMILKIHLPEEDHHNIDLKIMKKNILLVSSKYKLDMPLPQPVNPKLGNAQWDKETEKLIVTLRMDREFDYVNF